MRLIVVRHLETSLNAQGLLQGNRDEMILPLCDTRRRHLVDALDALLKGRSIDQVFVSDLTRTQQTAAAFGYSDCKIDSNLRELDFGPHEGRRRTDMLREVGDKWFNNPITLTLGEPITALVDRIRDFVASVANYDQILCFGHGAWMRALYAMACDGGKINGMNEKMIPNAGALIVETNGGGLIGAELHSLEKDILKTEPRIQGDS